MSLHIISGGSCGDDKACDKGPCPTIYETTSGTFVVQGDNAESYLHSEKIPLPDHERAVEIPRAVMEQFIERYSA